MASGMGIVKADVRLLFTWISRCTWKHTIRNWAEAGRDGKKAFPVLTVSTGRSRKNCGVIWNPDFRKITFIQQLYHHLCNHFQIAYGAGEGAVFDFDVVEFAKKYKVDLLSTMSALKFLERDGWISLSEAVFIPARFKFEIDYQELYKFQISNAKYDGLIKAILRSYGGAFDLYIHINEYEFAKKLKISYGTVVEMLKNLQKQQGRQVDYKNLYMRYAVYQGAERGQGRATAKAIMLILIQRIAEDFHIENILESRLRAPCGECDLCLIRLHRSHQEQKIKAEVKILLIDDTAGSS
ncbi:hypothetical protein FQR65_LT15176 [Abscondita terminalis]|nr:hypothetical protein FQR65_LT15176 [Abscondita terminalis]